MKTFLFDVDGICADFVKFYLEIVNKITGKNFTREDINQFDIDASLNLSQEHRDIVKMLVNQEGVAANLEVIPEAKNAILTIAKKANVVFVTSPLSTSKTWQYERANWLIKHFGDVGKKVISTHEKYLVDGDVFVDDSLKHINLWHEAHPKSVSVLFAQPWNCQSTRFMTTTNGWSHFRTNCWSHIIDLIKLVDRGTVDILTESTVDFDIDDLA